MNGRPLHILLIEDDDIDREMVVRGLSGQAVRLTITATPNATEALAILRGQAGHSTLGRPYVILLDLGLPGVSGFEFLQIVRQDPDFKRSTVFVLTGSSNPQDIRTAYAYNVAGYLLKEKLDPQYSQLVNLLEAYSQMNFPPIPTPIRQKRP